MWQWSSCNRIVLWRIWKRYWRWLLWRSSQISLKNSRTKKCTKCWIQGEYYAGGWLNIKIGFKIFDLQNTKIHVYFKIVAMWYLVKCFWYPVKIVYAKFWRLLRQRNIWCNKSLSRWCIKQARKIHRKRVRPSKIQCWKEIFLNYNIMQLDQRGTRKAIWQ